MKQLDLEALLDQTFFGLDTLAMLGDIEDFIEFSESNINWQKERELRRAENECDKGQFDNQQDEAQYRDQALNGVEYRFEVSLKQRVRYAGLIALITTIEWVLISLRARSAFTFPKKPNKKNDAIHILEVFNEKAALGLETTIKHLENLIQTRNCIIHAAGLLASYSHNIELRRNIEVMRGIKISNINFLGESIEIEKGFLEGIVADVKVWLPRLEKAALDNALLRKG